jgi:hypothetical protein
MNKDEWTNYLIQKKKMITGTVIAKNKKYVVIDDNKLVYDDGEVTDIASEYAPFSLYREFPFYKKNLLFGFIAKFHDINEYSILSENEEMYIMLDLLLEDIENHFISLPDGEFTGSDYLTALNRLVESDLFHTKEIAVSVVQKLFDYLVTSPTSKIPNSLRNYFKDESFKNGSNSHYWEDVEIIEKKEQTKTFKIAFYTENNRLVEDNWFYEESENLIEKIREKYKLDASHLIKFEKLPHTEILIEKIKYYEKMK